MLSKYDEIIQALIDVRVCGVTHTCFIAGGIGVEQIHATLTAPARETRTVLSLRLYTFHYSP